MKEEMQARVLSYLYLFMTHEYRDIGAGDLATASVLTGLSGNNGKRGKPMYNSTHGLITKIYNDMTNSSLPGYILNLPKLYAITNEDWLRLFNSHEGNRGVLRGVSELIAIMDEIETIDYMSIQNYYFLWFNYINRIQNVTIYCESRNGCTDYKKFELLDLNNPSKLQILKSIKYRGKGIYIEGNLLTPPCMSIKIIDTFKIAKICSLLEFISKTDNQFSFLEMMKHSIQAPVFSESYDEFFENANETLAKYGYNFKQTQVRIFIGP